MIKYISIIAEKSRNRKRGKMKKNWGNYAKLFSFKKGEAIFFRGEEVKGLHILREGTAVAEMLKENGDVNQIEEMQGETFLASAFVFGKNPYYPVDLRAKTDCNIYFIPKETLISVFQEEPEILEKFVNDISSKAQFLSNRLWSQFQYKSIGSKLNQYLLSHEKEGSCCFDRSLKELAELFGVTRPSLSRVLGQYVEEGILQRNGRNQYKILDRESLEEN